MKKLLVVGLFLALLIPRLAFGEPDETGCAVGSIFIFGTYEQDNDTTNGKEPIEWIILDKRDDGSLVLLSKYALDCKPYNTEHTGVTWETCTLRRWLNEDFYNAAFSAAEQARIVPVMIENEDNPYYGTTGGRPTTDKVWLLSINEVTNEFTNEKVYTYFTDDTSRMCAPTKYAVEQGAWQSSDYTVDGVGACWWWLRSPAYDLGIAAYVDCGGLVIYYSYFFSIDDYSIRPVVVVLPLPTDDVLYSQQRESELPISKPTSTPVPTYVYCNDNGKYYHVEGCRYVYSTTPKVTLNAAINAGKTACPVCIGYYGTPGGKWYHVVSNCQGMTNAITQTKADWEKAGKTACPVCMNETANEVQNTSAPTETQVYCAGGNENFHVLSDCLGMKNATQMGISKAVSMSKTACKYCMLPAKVYVFATQNGTYYHTLATCQGMEGAQYVTAKRAISAGKRPCPKCDASKLFATSTDTQTTPQNTSPTPMPVGMYSQVNSSTQN